MLKQQKHVAITYTGGTLARSAVTLTVRWSHNNWTSATDPPMTRQSDDSWRATVSLPTSTSTLTMVFYNQSEIWTTMEDETIPPAWKGYRSTRLLCS